MRSAVTASDWGGLSPDLLALSLRVLCTSLHAEEGGTISARTAAQLWATVCANQNWRGVALWAVSWAAAAVAGALSVPPTAEAHIFLPFP